MRLSGQLRTREAAALVGAVRDATAGAQVVQIDLGGADEVDGGVIALLYVNFATRGVRVGIDGGDRFRPLLELYAVCTTAPRPRLERAPERLLAHVGRATVQEVASTESALGFFGEITVAVGRLASRARRGHWSEIPRLVEVVGADAIPIVLIINFLLGFVIAYMSARELATFGANIFVADLVGIAMARQLGPLMTAIIVSGRSGAAFTTELGSMKVSAEIDALRTLGLEPFSWLVLPRVLTLVIALPVLTLLADVVGIFGGLLVAVMTLDLTPRAYLNEMRRSLAFWDVESGLIMSLAFAIAIGLIACQQGFAASGGPAGVGRRTTSAVVRSLFAIVILDAMFTVLFDVFGGS